METPTLEQVKDYFKNAKAIESIVSKFPYLIDHSRKVVENEIGFYCQVIAGGYICIFDKQTKKYAEILAFIDPSTYTLPKTELQVLKEKYTIAKTTLEAVLFYIVPDDCRTMVSQALDELNDKKPK